MCWMLFLLQCFESPVPVKAGNQGVHDFRAQGPQKVKKRKHTPEVAWECK